MHLHVQMIGRCTGKMGPGFPRLLRLALDAVDIGCDIPDQVRAERAAAPPCVPTARPSAALLVYGEDCPAILHDVATYQHALETAHPGVRIFQPESVGQLLGHKAATRAWLAEMGVPVPALLAPGQKGFVNDAISSSRGRAGQWVKGAYCTAFVDTRREFQGRKFYWYVRAQCVGPTVTMLDARFQPESHGPNVRGLKYRKVAPREQIGHFNHVELPRVAEGVTVLASHIGAALGLGFWSVDILPSIDGRLIVSEVGMKADEARWLEDNGMTHSQTSQSAACAFAGQLRELLAC